MTMTVDRPSRRTTSPLSPSQRLRTTFAAARGSFTWFGVRMSLISVQKGQAAESFGAEGQFLSAAKKLLDTRDEKFQAVTRLIAQALGVVQSDQPTAELYQSVPSQQSLQQNTGGPHR